MDEDTRDALWRQLDATPDCDKWSALRMIVSAEIRAARNQYFPEVNESDIRYWLRDRIKE